MFRLTIRELMLATVIAGMGLSWGMEHRSHLAVREDAEHLARHGRPSGGCGFAAGAWYSVADQYSERSADLGHNYDPYPRIIIQEEDEAKLGIEIEP